MRVSFDLDRTITRYPEIFVTLGRALRLAGHTVYILTGIDRATFEEKRVKKYGFLLDKSWWDELITSDNYNDDEKRIAADVIAGRVDNHILVGQYKRRVCRELDISVHFDDDVEHVRKAGSVPVFGVA